ncbi:unnamed protein product, partial [Choristocarpus tenellus]
PGYVDGLTLGEKHAHLQQGMVMQDTFLHKRPMPTVVASLLARRGSLMVGGDRGETEIAVPGTGSSNANHRIGGDSWGPMSMQLQWRPVPSAGVNQQTQHEKRDQWGVVTSGEING